MKTKYYLVPLFMPLAVGSAFGRQRTITAGSAITETVCALGERDKVIKSGGSTLFSDHFYIVKDADEHYYKLRFESILRDGARGTPQFEYAFARRKPNSVTLLKTESQILKLKSNL